MINRLPCLLIQYAPIDPARPGYLNQAFILTIVHSMRSPQNAIAQNQKFAVSRTRGIGDHKVALLIRLRKISPSPHVFPVVLRDPNGGARNGQARVIHNMPRQYRRGLKLDIHLSLLVF